MLRGSGRVALVACLIAAFVGGSANPAAAAVIRPFGVRYTANTTGDITLTGNALLTCASGSACTAAQGGGSTNNNSLFMRYVDVDGADATPTAASDNSSRAQLTLSAASQVLFAGLYWGADTSAGGASGSVPAGVAAPNPSARGQAQFTPPGASPTPIVAARVDAQGARYQAFADVTALVRAAGSGWYTMGDIQAGTGADRYGGWALVVAYQDPVLPVRNLTVFDGYAVIQTTPTSDRTVDIPVSGFQTPNAGPVNTRVGAVSYEGDLASSGDQLLVQGSTGFTNLGNATNPTTNVFNSTVTDLGVPNANRDPAHTNLLGFDVDRFDATGILPNGATSTTLRVTTTSETYFPGVLTFATDLYAPALDLVKVGADSNGGDLEAGDTIVYDVTATNTGRDVAVDTIISDLIPAGTTFVPGSLRVNGAPATDAVGDDAGEFVAASTTARFFAGTGGSSANGGSLAIGASTTVRLAVTVDAGIPDGALLENQAVVAYEGGQTGIGVSGASNVVVAPAVARSDLTITKVATGASPVTTPGAVAWLVTVQNRGPRAEPAAIVTDPMPAGVTASAAIPSQGSCTLGPTVTCALGPLAVGATASVVLEAQVPSRGDTLENTARVDGANTDPEPADDEATASVTLNRPPSAGADAVTTPPGTPVTIAVLANDGDADGDPLTIVDPATTPPARGTVFVVVQPDGTPTIVYTPAAGAKGTDTFAYTVGDGRGGAATATVTVAVPNAPPVAVDDAAGTPINTPVAGSVLGNDTDPNGDPLTATLISGPAGGTFALAPDGSYTFTPDPGFTGTQVATYAVSDGDGGRTTATLMINVTNDAPVAIDDRVELSVTDTSATINVLANDTDGNAPFDDITVTGVVDAAGDPVDPGVLTFAADGTVTFTAAPGRTGEFVFTYTIMDEGGATDSATVTFVVPNHPPVAADDAVTVAPVGATPLDVTGNDGDPDGDPLTVVGTSGPTPANGTVAVDGSGRPVFTPAPGVRGVSRFTYTVSDGRGGTSTATVTVTVPNQAPVAAPDTRTTASGTPVLLPVLTNDTDANGDALAVTAVSVPMHGTVVINADGTLTYTPDPTFVGTETLTYTVADGAGGVTTATVAIEVLNAPPDAVDDRALTDAGRPVTIAPLRNDTDGNGDALRIVGVADPPHGRVVLNADGTVTYTPDPGFDGVETLTYTIADGRGGTAVATISVTVAPVPPPSGGDDADGEIPGGQAATGTSGPIPVLPFTGRRSVPLAGVGVLLAVTGLALVARGRPSTGGRAQDARRAARQRSIASWWSTIGSG